MKMREGRVEGEGSLLPVELLRLLCYLYFNTVLFCVTISSAPASNPPTPLSRNGSLEEIWADGEQGECGHTQVIDVHYPSCARACPLLCRYMLIVFRGC